MKKVLIAYSPKRITYNRDGKPLLEHNILSTVLEVERSLTELDFRVTKAGLRTDPQQFISEVKRFAPDIIFNLCEEVGGEASNEKNAASLFELLSIPFTGNPPLALGLCLDKPLTKSILKANEIPTPPFTLLSTDEINDMLFNFPAIVKPSKEDGSLGITARSVVKNSSSLKKRVSYIIKYFKQPALVEKYIEGREIQVSLLGNKKPRILAISELSYEGLPEKLPRICTYSAKWETESRYYKFTNPVIPARLKKNMRQQVKEIALKTFHIFSLRGYARVDFRISDNIPYVIDVNPNPDISPDAGFARAAKHAKMSYTKLIREIVELAMENGK